MPDSLDHLIASAEASLMSAQRMLAEEISQYPTPISGCDAQFNHLLSERSRIGAALTALQKQVFVPTPRMPNERAGVESR